MTTPHLELLVADHGRELRWEAASARLVAIARCCQPSAWGRAAQRATQATAGLLAAVRRDRPAAPCCA